MTGRKIDVADFRNPLGMWVTQPDPHCDHDFDAESTECGLDARHFTCTRCGAVRCYEVCANEQLTHNLP
jgi:hypothetical protein